MSFRMHLSIIVFIVTAIYGAWFVFAKNTPLPGLQQTTSPYSISISQASWGLNCRPSPSHFEATSGGFAVDSSTGLKLAPGNVQANVAELCDGKPRCEIPLNFQPAGKDPAPDCPEKELEVEYRCFSFDRPWRIRSTSAPMVIDCTAR